MRSGSDQGGVRPVTKRRRHERAPRTDTVGNRRSSRSVKLAEAARAVCAAGRTLSERGFTPGTSGNISVRTADGYVMTPTNVSLGALNAEDVSVLAPDGAHLAGGAPTRERNLHLAFYARRPDARAIVHVHSTYAVALSCLHHANEDDVLRPLTPYAIMRAGRLALTSYARSGSPELVAQVASRAAEHRAILLANHGPIVAAATLEAAVAAIDEIEEAAKLQILLEGREVRLLSAADIEELQQ
jgi:ribulose-5-phosphate 4-epimerase/fuculose-1-phosphate aldolase